MPQPSHQSRTLPSLPLLLPAFTPKLLVSSMFAGLLIGAIVLVFEISVVVLIFSGDLSVFAAQGIGFVIFGSIILGLIVSLGSSLHGVIAIPQDNTGVVLALIAASISGALPASATPEERFMTVMAAIILAGVVTGLSLLFLGVFKLGNLTRFIPYPVIGGILAGTGWLLFRGGISVMSDINLSLDSLPTLFGPDMLLRWVPGLVYAVLLFVVTRRSSHHLIIPGLTILAVACFYVWLLLSGTSREAAVNMGLLLQPFSTDETWRPLNPDMLSNVNWPVLAGQLGSLLTIPFMTVISVLLNAAGIELDGNQDADLNRELVVTGIGNLAAGMAGGLVGYHALSFSMLMRRMTTPNRFVGIIVALLGLVALLAGTSMVLLLPKLVFGGLLVFFGLSLLAEWLYDTLRWLSRADYLIVWLILILIATVGFLEGVGVGVIVTVVLFAAKYSRVNVVKYALSGASYRSNMDRPLKQHHVLSEKGDQLHIFRLQGYIFFGTAHSLYSLVRERISSPQPLRYILLDFRLVTGIDSSAILSFSKMMQYAERCGVTLICTEVSDPIRSQLENNSHLKNNGTQIHIFPDLDYGLEWCEDRILAAESADVDAKRYTLEVFLVSALPEPFHLPDLMRYFERIEIGAGEYLIRHNTQADDLFFIETGQVTAYMEFEDGRTIRLRTMGAGTVVGEIGLYLGQSRSASVVADRPTTAYRLTAEALRKMETEDAPLAVAFNRFMVQLLAERLYHTDNTLRMVLE
jgi:SulP family sulfate permease